MKYFSELTNDVYETIEELEQAEEKKKNELDLVEQKKAEKKRRAEEVTAAFVKVREAQKEADKLLEEFCKDYGAFHTSVSGPDAIPIFPNFLDALFRW